MSEYPVVEAMRRWLQNEAPVPTLAEFYERFGRYHRDWRHTWNDPDHRDLEAIRWGRDVAEVARRYKERHHFIDEFGFAMPVMEALLAIANGGPVVEVGAGTGSWAKLLQNLGADCIATDSWSDARYGFTHGTWAEVIKIDALAAVKQYPDRNVFCSWPSLGEPWLKDAAEAMLPGRTLYVVREEATADEDTWAYIESTFTEAGWIELPVWTGLHDRLEIWRKP